MHPRHSESFPGQPCVLRGRVPEGRVGVSAYGLGMTASVSRFIRDIPKFVVSFLLVAAIVNLLIGVFLRYVMIEATDSLYVAPILFTWVSEVGATPPACLTLIPPSIRARARVSFTLHAPHLS